MEPNKRFSDSAPYPAIQVEGPNAAYAKEMLDNIGSRDSEMTAISLYIYNSTILKAQKTEFSENFHHIAIVEMHHLDIFSQLALQLGADPRLWCRRSRGMTYWNPSYNEYPRALPQLIRYAQAGEEKAIAQYRRQSRLIQDPHIVAILERVIKDEELHLALFRKMLKQC